MNRPAKASGRPAQFPAALVLVFVLGAAAAAAGAPVRSSYNARITADEPEYLLTAMSLGEDRSLDISDEIAERRYRPFHEVVLDPQAKRLEGGRMVSPHDPLLPALLVPGALAGGWLGAKLTLSAMAGVLAALLLWTAVRRFDLPEWRSALVVGLFAASAPFAVYGSQIYPELPAAVAVTVAVACITGPLRWRGLAGLVGSIVALAWLGAKFIPVAAVLAALPLWRMLRAGRRWEVVGVCVVFAVAGAGYLAGHLRWYGDLTVYATGEFFAETGQFSVVGVTPDYADRASRLVGLLVDRRFGLAAWQPAWLLVVPAVAGLAFRRPANWAVLLMPLSVGWLSATFLALTMHGWWWPGRQLVAVLPAAVLAIAWWAASARRVAAVGVLGAVGVLNLGWLFIQGWRRELTMIVDFYETTNPLYRESSRLLPDYIRIAGTDWVLHAIWVALAFAAALGAAIGAGASLQRFRRPGKAADPRLSSGNG